MNKRQKLVQQRFLNNEEAVIKRLRQVYSKSYADITAKSKRLYDEFEDLKAEYDLLDDEAEKAVLKSRMQSKIYQKQYQDSLKKQVGDILDKMNKEQFTAVSDYLNKCYEEGFVGTLYDIQGQGLPLAFPLDQEAMVRAVQLDSPISEGLYNHLGEDVNMLKKHITAQVSRGISTGMAWGQVAKNLSDKMMGTYKNPKGSYAYAMRIARTEGHRIQCQSTMDACHKAKDRGADVVKQWDSTLDGKTRTSHVNVDGEFKELDEKFSNDLMFPGDPNGGAAEVVNCRCALLQRARWAINSGFTKMNNFTKQLETFDSPESYAEFKKGFFSKENKQYMNYVEQMQKKYQTRDFQTILGSMTDREYKHYSKLLAKNPMFNKKAKVAKVSDVAKATPKTSTFVPAKTVEEAQSVAKSMGVPYAKYEKLPLDTANRMNEALTKLPDDVRPIFVGDSVTLEQYWGGKLPRSSTKYYGVTIDTFDGLHFGWNEALGRMDYDLNAHGQMVGISSSYKKASKVTLAKKEFNSRYASKYEGHTWFFNESGETVPDHEMGHVYEHVKGLPNGFETVAKKWAEDSKCDMLANPKEAWSEAWASYHTGINIEKVPDDVLEFIRKASEK